ncbi:MAG: spore cortex biosynthesis protein YabQ [Anaerovorax sp.]
MSTGVNPLIYFQVFEVVIMFYAGLLIMVGEEVFSTVKMCIKPSVKATFLMDLVFWVLLSLVFTSFLYYASYGKISIPGFVGFFVGLILWKKWFYGTIKDKFKGEKTMK